MSEPLETGVLQGKEERRKAWREVAIGCGLSYLIAAPIVFGLWPFVLWPILRPYLEVFPWSILQAFSIITSVVLMVVIKAMELKLLDPRGLPFLRLYRAACFLFGISGLHPAVKNLGMVWMEMSFVVMLSHEIWSKKRSAESKA